MFIHVHSTQYSHLVVIECALNSNISVTKLVFVIKGLAYLPTYFIAVNVIAAVVNSVIYS